MIAKLYSSLFPTFLLQKMFKKKSDPRLVEMETENKQLKREIETLKRENAELREMNNQLKQSLDESVTKTRPQPAADSSTESELQRRLKQLSDVQERLTILEQVTAATQKRELQQEGVYENLPSHSVYEKLRFDPTQEHVYTKLRLTTHIGCVIVFSCCEIQSLFVF